ncbi:MAG: phosphoribosylglycinamide formyltransferase [Myxococcales bacterium]|nr:phosphoribosylglycinamide formyltransferase [Myxococcales bacterium]USN50141.1 MAG: phosphoribosylglycinamide formyltransferase [Myxococcales bacterium]
MHNKNVIFKIAQAINYSGNDFKIGVLVSGGGSNLQSLIDFSKTPAAHYKVAAVISNASDNIALERAQKAGIPHRRIHHKDFAKKEDFEVEMIHFLEQEEVHLIVLAGFLRVLSSTFVNYFYNRIINLHPSLLPKFPGLHAIRQALEAKESVSGCTVHLVDQGLDTGEIIAQSSCPIEPSDSRDKLDQKIHRLEHQLLPRIVNEIAQTTRSQLS